MIISSLVYYICVVQKFVFSKIFCWLLIFVFFILQLFCLYFDFAIFLLLHCILFFNMTTCSIKTTTLICYNNLYTNYQYPTIVVGFFLQLNPFCSCSSHFLCNLLKSGAGRAFIFFPDSCGLGIWLQLYQLISSETSSFEQCWTSYKSMLLFFGMWNLPSSA